MPQQTIAQPDVSLCVSFCEIAQPDASAEQLEALLASTCETAGFPHCERIYAGSYFCENYFCGLGDGFHESLGQLCRRYDLAASLVVPIVGQAFLERAGKRIDEVLERYGDLYDEIIVNDAAAFLDLGERTGKRMGLGRLMQKERRDARIRPLMQRTATPELSPESLECLHAQAGTARPLVELDPVADVVDASHVLEAVPQAEIALHLPLCFATTGRNCGPASIDEPVDQKFRLGRGCSRHCLRMDQGYLTDGNVRYVKHGRTFYYDNARCAIAGTGTWRIVYAAM